MRIYIRFSTNNCNAIHILLCIHERLVVKYKFVQVMLCR